MAKVEQKDQRKSQQKKSAGISVDDLAFYFDAQERNRLDFGALGRRSGQVLVLRERLMQMHPEHFDDTMRSISALVSSQPSGGLLTSAGPNSYSNNVAVRAKEAMTLFEKAKDSPLISTPNLDQA